MKNLNRIFEEVLKETEEERFNPRFMVKYNGQKRGGMYANIHDAFSDYVYYIEHGDNFKNVQIIDMETGECLDPKEVEEYYDPNRVWQDK